jgi:hypothetical protein
MKGSLLLDLGPNALVLAHRTGERVEVLQQVSPGWREHNGRNLRQLLAPLRNPGITGSAVVVGLPHPPVELRCETLASQIPEREATRAILNRLQAGPEPQRWSNRVALKNLGGSREAAIARVDSQLLQELIHELEQLGFEVAAIRPRSLGLWKALPNEALWLHLEPGAGHLAGIVRGQVVHFEAIPDAVEASLSFSLGRSYLQPDHPLTPRGESWNPIRRHAALQEPLAQLQQRVQGLGQSLESRFGLSPAQLYFTGAPAYWPEARLLLGLGSWEIASPGLPDLECSPLLLAQHTHLAGLCLENPLDWLPETRRNPLLLGNRGWSRIAGTSLLVTLLLATTGLVWQRYRQQQTLQLLEAQWQQLMPFVLEQEQLTGQLASFRKTLEIRDLLYTQRIDWPHTLARLLARIPPTGIQLSTLQLGPGTLQPDLNFDGKSPRLLIEMAGIANSRRDLEGLLSRLDYPPRYAVSLHNSQAQVNSSRWEFTLSVAQLQESR